MRLVARKENDPRSGLFDVNRAEAERLNPKGYSILTPVNDLPTGFKQTDVRAILFWYVECDYKSCGKPPLNLVLSNLLLPSKVIETKAGYHIYFRSINATFENYKDIQTRLVSVYNGDLNARNVNRFLRAPDFLHLKDPNSPFLVRQVFESNASYREELLLKILPETEKRPVTQYERPWLPPQTGRFHEWISNQNQMDLLKALSGHELVNFDHFSFVPIPSGKFNTLTNGKPSPFWIDEKGLIGSPSNGGPTVIQFIKWYGRLNYPQIIHELKRIFT